MNEWLVLKLINNSSVYTKKCAGKRIYHKCEVRMSKSVPWVTVWHPGRDSGCQNNNPWVRFAGT